MDGDVNCRMQKWLWMIFGDRCILIGILKWLIEKILIL